MPSYEGHLPYRDGIGILLLNSHQDVFTAQRLQAPSHVWQMPQGGIDVGETCEETVFRELKEEIGTNNAQIIAVHNQWLYYDFPLDILKDVFKGRYRGQRQKWFALKFTGLDDEINIHTQQPEFQNWRWSEPQNIINENIFFKTEVYRIIMAELYPQAVDILLK